MYKTGKLYSTGGGWYMWLEGKEGGQNGQMGQVRLIITFQPLLGHTQTCNNAEPVVLYAQYIENAFSRGQQA